jgi:acetyl esterase
MVAMSNPPKISATSSTEPRANAVKSTKAVKATKARTTKATQRSTTSATPAADPTGEGGAGRGHGRGAGRAGDRRLGLYNRQLQRNNERWPLAAGLVSWLFRRPELVLALLGKQAPIQVNGRVLNRSTQAMLEVSKRLESVTGRGDMGDGLGDPVVMRRQLQRMALIAMPIRTDVHVVGRLIPAADSPRGSSGIPVRIYRRFGTGLGAGVGLGTRPPAIVYYHGGGWVTGDLISHDASCRLLAAVSGCVVVAVDYRLAPEDPFPAAVDDALAAYAWVCGHAEELGIAEDRVGVMGDSAGGNLAAVVALLTRKGTSVPTASAKASTTGSAGTAAPGIPSPFAQGLIYPGLSTRFDSESMRIFSEGFFLTLQSMKGFRRTYLPDQSDWELDAASPLLAAEVDGVAPALVVTAGFDPLRDEGQAYANKLKSAGVDVEYRCYDDQVHGFFNMGILADSLALSIEVCDTMGRLMHRADPTQTEE